MTKKISHAASGTALDVSAIQKLVEEAQSHFSAVVRMTTTDKKHAAKLRRGAHQVLPLIAKLATKYAVQVPGASTDDMTSNLDYAQSLEPLLGTVAVLHETLRDAHLNAQSSAWKTGVTSYGMMKKAAKANVSLSNELTPVAEWFRQRAKGQQPNATPAAPTGKAAGAQNAAAVKPSGAAATATANAPASASAPST
ncbi:MAG TPA: hypothetical protein VGI39_27325 [Polyangiaceae bacterium]|jgi:hypothetical protein